MMLLKPLIIVSKIFVFVVVYFSLFIPYLLFKSFIFPAYYICFNNLMVFLFSIDL